MLLSIAQHAFGLQSGRVALSGAAADLATDERVKALYLGHAEGEYAIRRPGSQRARCAVLRRFNAL